MQNAMIWGAGGGIGRALTQELTHTGWNVIAITHGSANQSLTAAHVVDADVSDPYEIQLALSSASQIIDEINLWIYAAGDITSAKVAEMPGDVWQRIMDANLTGAFLTVHYSLSLLATDAHLVFLGAISERLRLPGLAAYAAAKAGLEAFVEVLGKEERKRRITIIRPAAVDTPLWEKVPLRLPAQAHSPNELARRIIGAYQQGHQGTLDIT